MTTEKPVIYLASPVFHNIADHEKVSMKFKYALNKSWTNLNTSARVIVSDKRFPKENEIKKAVENHRVDFIGCHIGHSITEDILSVPTVKAVATANVGVNHIANVLTCASSSPLTVPAPMRTRGPLWPTKCCPTCFS